MNDMENIDEKKDSYQDEELIEKINLLDKLMRRIEEYQKKLDDYVGITDIDENVPILKEEIKKALSQYLEEVDSKINNLKELLGTVQEASDLLNSKILEINKININEVKILHEKILEDKALVNDVLRETSNTLSNIIQEKDKLNEILGSINELGLKYEQTKSTLISTLNDKFEIANNLKEKLENLNQKTEEYLEEAKKIDYKSISTIRSEIGNYLMSVKESKEELDIIINSYTKAKEEYKKIIENLMIHQLEIDNIKDSINNAINQFNNEKNEVMNELKEFDTHIKNSREIIFDDFKKIVSESASVINKRSKEEIFEYYQEKIKKINDIHKNYLNSFKKITLVNLFLTLSTAVLFINFLFNIFRK